MRKLKIRLAFREEGSFWNAYLALPNTMDGAKLIGSIAIGAVKGNSGIKTKFMDVMKDIIAEAIKDTTGTVVDDWSTEHAAEAERAGHS